MALCSPVVVLVATRAFQAPAYVNSDCGTRAMAFDRIQVNALVRMVTAKAGRSAFTDLGRVRWGFPPLTARFATASRSE